MTSATAEPATAPDAETARKGYVRPEVLVTTQWLAAHLDDPKIRILESDEDVLLFDTGHIPNAQKVDWHADLNDPVVRDYISSEQFEELLRSKGIDESTTVVFYGDKNNWWATYAFWVFQLFGFTNARILDGATNHAWPAQLFRNDGICRADVRLRIETKAEKLGGFAYRTHQHGVEMLLRHTAKTSKTLHAFVAVDARPICPWIDVNGAHGTNRQAIATGDALMGINFHNGNRLSAVSRR